MEPMGIHHKPEDPGFTPTIRASFKRTRCLPALGGLLLLNIALKFLVAGTGFAKIVNIGISVANKFHVSGPSFAFRFGAWQYGALLKQIRDVTAWFVFPCGASIPKPQAQNSTRAPKMQLY